MTNRSDVTIKTIYDRFRESNGRPNNTTLDLYAMSQRRWRLACLSLRCALLYHERLSVSPRNSVLVLVSSRTAAAQSREQRTLEFCSIGGQLANGSMNIVTRGLEDAADASSDYQRASVAFISAAVIWVVIVVCFIVLVLLQYKREREYLVACGRGQDVDWTASLTRSILVSSDNILAKSDADINIRKSSMLDARYNFQTIFLALVQASISMAILGGIQLNFEKTIRIVCYAVLGWTVLIGVIATLWMSCVPETVGENAFDEVNTGNDRRQKLSRQPANDPTDTVLHNLKHELHGNPLLFAKHFVEMSFFKPLINTSQLVAGDIYQDVGRDGSRTLLLGLGQIILLSMYAFNVVDDGKPDLSNQRLYSFYCCGILMQIAYMSGQDVLLKSIHSHFSFWGNALRAARMNNSYCWEPPTYLMYHRPHMVLTSGSVRGFGNEATIRLSSNSLFLWLRFLCSTIINVGGLNVITLLLPLQLASNDDPLNFVMASVGAYYILGIDDYGEPIRYNLVMQNDVPVATNTARYRSEDGGGEFAGRVEMASIDKQQRGEDLSNLSAAAAAAAAYSSDRERAATDYRHMT